MRSLVVLAVLAGCKAPPPPPPVGVAITLEYPGARAEVLEATAVVHVETAIVRVPGVAHIESRIDGDHALVIVEVDGELDTVARALNLAISEASLPAEMSPPELRRMQRDERPIATLVLRGDAQPITTVSAFGRDEVKRRLERVMGVARVEPHGLAEPTLIVWPDLDRINAYGLALFDVIEALQATEASAPDVLADVVVKAPVRLADVARIELGFEREPGEPTLAVFAQIGSVREEVHERVREALAEIQRPPGLAVTEAPPPPRAATPHLVGTLYGDSIEVLQRLAGEIAAELRTAGSEVVLDPPPGTPETSVLPDRDRAARLGVRAADIVATLHAVHAGRVGGSFDGPPVAIKIPPASLEETIAKLHVRDRTGMLVPMTNLVTLQATIAQPILRIDHRRAIRISVRGSETAARRIIRAYTLPPGYHLQ